MSVEAKKQKQLIIDEIKGKLETAKAAVLVDYIGISVTEADAMRKKLREAGIDYTIYKNTFIRRAIEGTAFEALEPELHGPTALVISDEDPAAPARAMSEIIKSIKKMEFKAGMVEGSFFDKDGIEEIASIPSRDVLIAKFMGSVQSPVSKMVRTLQAVADAKE